MSASDFLSGSIASRHLERSAAGIRTPKKPTDQGPRCNTTTYTDACQIATIDESTCGKGRRAPKGPAKKAPAKKPGVRRPPRGK